MFAFRLADKWGIPNPDLMLEVMDAGHLPEWDAFFAIEEKERRRAELEARAEVGLQQARARR